MSTTAYVAFVRAVMVGREGLHRDVLTGVFERAGATEVVSHLATGNVSFAVSDERVDEVTDDVEEALAGLLGRPTPLFVRSHDELVELVAAGLFDDPPFREVRDRIVTFFRQTVPTALTLPIQHPGGDWVVFARGRREVGSVTRAWDDGRHPGAPGGVIERRAGEPVTSRALSTVELIVSKLS